MLADIKTKELTPDLWPMLEKFFLSENCSGCWCMNHRLQPGQVLEGEPARLGLKDAVSKGEVFGVLAFDNEKPIGWCAFDPMKDLPGLDCAYPASESKPNDIWSIHCMSVLSAYPKDKVVEEMVKASVLVMKRRGARIIEGYPPPSLPSDNKFSGTVEIFERQGFQLKEEVNKFFTRMVRQLLN